MGYIFAVDTALTMGLQPDGEPSLTLEASRYGVASRIIAGLVSRAKQMVPEPKISLYHMGVLNEMLIENVPSESAALELLASNVDLKGASNTGLFLDQLSARVQPTCDDHIIVLTDATAYDGDLNFFAPCECRFIVINTCKNGTDPLQIEELEEISAESCGYEVGDEYEEYYHLFYMTEETTEESIVDAVTEEMFVTPVYRLILGNFSAMISATPPVWEDRPFELEVIGFSRVQNTQALPIVTTHHILPEPPVIKNEVEPRDEVFDGLCDPRSEDIRFLNILLESLVSENMTAVCRFGSGRFATVGFSTDENERHNLVLAMLPESQDMPSFLPKFDELLVGPMLPLLGKFDPHVLIVPEAEVAASYFANVQSWITAHGIQNDVQKILRYFRKLPERADQFYLELNRIRQHASIIGCQSLLSELANVLRQESAGMNEHVRRHCSHAAEHLEQDISQFNGAVPDIPILR